MVLSGYSLRGRLDLVRLRVGNLDVGVSWSGEAAGVAAHCRDGEVCVAGEGDGPDGPAWLGHQEGAVLSARCLQWLVEYLVVPVPQAGIVFPAMGEEGRSQCVGIVAALVLLDEVDTHGVSFLGQGLMC